MAGDQQRAVIVGKSGLDADTQDELVMLVHEPKGIEGIEERMAELFTLVEESLAEVPAGSRDKREIEKALAGTKRAADELIGRVVDLTKKAGSPRGERYQNSGAAGSAEDLL